ncbi:hypothetical protein GCM10010156_48900 [Planobispora rosea]|uniref:Uncharacterized protein n=1 Tax=Planobispora rosea TaxID=35762 RepID=A0A8J3WG06_PLARO|nr:hypothetical protein [Planobispora rosea]GGS84503.1 hypothetical protein GCM10010156_48900 [Planobispora rosea]GIH86401.1 hypothetical protein Pro02_48090 [Planobispora rosea]
MSAPEWSGDMLDRPEMMAAFAAQLRRSLAESAEFVAYIRRDAEAMWKENPPEGYGSFEAWWRHRWVTSPFAEIQEHLEAAAALTFRLEARYRRGRHEIPQTRQARREAAQGRQAPALPHARDYVGRPPAPKQARPSAAAPDGDFLDLVHDHGKKPA